MQKQLKSIIKAVKTILRGVTTNQKLKNKEKEVFSARRNRVKQDYSDVIKKNKLRKKLKREKKEIELL